jgi:hypothetical protein
MRANPRSSIVSKPDRKGIICIVVSIGFGLYQHGAHAQVPMFADDFEVSAEGPCTQFEVILKMFWDSCDGSLDCFEAVDPGDGETYRFLRLPSQGPVVEEAHLVTVAESFGGGWPDNGTDGIQAHYAISEAESGYSTSRDQPWAPAGEGGSEWGQGATGTKLPVLDEAWYISMFWRDRPPKGTRMIVRNPANGKAVVAAGGYETGPGSNTTIAGVAEEIHAYLGSAHRDELQVGIAHFQDIPLGPIDCP